MSCSASLPSTREHCRGGVALAGASIVRSASGSAARRRRMLSNLQVCSARTVRHVFTPARHHHRASRRLAHETYEMAHRFAGVLTSTSAAGSIRCTELCRLPCPPAAGLRLSSRFLLNSSKLRKVSPKLCFFLKRLFLPRNATRKSGGSRRGSGSVAPEWRLAPLRWVWVHRRWGS